MNKLVSVIITTYNRLELLKKALKSVQKQSYDNIEIIVVDGSDNKLTENYISNDGSIIYAKSKKNHPNILRNLGLECSNGDFIAFLDDDDTWEKEKIEKQIQCFQNNDIGLCYTGKNVLDKNDQKINYSYKSGRFSSDFKSILWDNFIGITSSIMIKKNILDVTGFFDEKLPALQDYDFCIRVCQNFQVLGINEALVNYKYLYSQDQVSNKKINFNLSCQMLKNKYSNSYLLRFGLWKLKLKKRIKKIYE